MRSGHLKVTLILLTLFGHMHEWLEVHQYCAEHGHAIHSPSHSHEPVSLTASVILSEDEDSHSHCAWLGANPPHKEIATLEPSVLFMQLKNLPQKNHHSLIDDDSDLYLFFPKNSPPV